MAAAKQFLASTPLAKVLPDHSLVTVTTGCRLEAAIKTLHDNGILSCPVMQKEVRVLCGFAPRQPPQMRADESN